MAAAPAWTLNELMQALHQVGTADERFRESRTLGMLTGPIVATGTLRYRAPGHLERITEQPAPERLVLDGDKVTVETDSGKAMSFALDQRPELGTLAAGIRAVLAGDQATLQRLFTVDFKGSAESWQMVLVPSQRRVRETIQWIRISGVASRLTELETVGQDGDRSDMTITPLEHP